MRAQLLVSTQVGVVLLALRVAGRPTRGLA
jgi:hypothetical protein